MAKNAGMYWWDGITGVITARTLALTPALKQLGVETAQDMLEYARANAPWEDRTGNARNKLTTEVSGDSYGQISITLEHGVDYGYWLEVIQNGRFAILQPTIEAFADNFFIKAQGVTIS